MAKKKQAKKHKFKYTEPSTAAGIEMNAGRATMVESSSNGGGRRVAMAQAAAGARDFSYVGVDVRRIAVLAVSLVLVEALLWYLFAHTGVGNSVYSWFNVY